MPICKIYLRKVVLVNFLRCFEINKDRLTVCKSFNRFCLFGCLFLLSRENLLVIFLSPQGRQITKIWFNPSPPPTSMSNWIHHWFLLPMLCQGRIDLWNNSERILSSFAFHCPFLLFGNICNITFVILHL